MNELQGTTLMPNASNSTDSGIKIEEDVLPALVQCFGIILIGYIAGRSGLTSESGAKGLNIFVQYFSLPALVFSSIAAANFSNVNWSFLLCIFLAKTIVFILVASVTMLLSNPVDTGKAGLYGIFATQSNDFALGYPILLSIYSKQHTDYPNYMYFIAPIQLLILNPIGILLMEMHKHQRHSSTKNIAWAIFKGICTNPIIVMTVAGIIGNFVFNHHIPLIISKLLQALGSAFSATALFLLGLTMVGNVNSLKAHLCTVPALLVGMKILILPIIIHKLITHISVGNVSEVESLSSFGFLYGTFPCAPTAFVFAMQYDVSVAVVASGMMASTMLSAPLVIASSTMITLTVSGFKNMHYHLMQSISYVSIASMICCVWVIGLFVLSRKYKRVTHGTTLCLVCAQLMVAVGGVLWSTFDSNCDWKFYVQYAFSVGGVFASRIWTAILALLIALLHQRSLCYVLRIRYLVIAVGFGISIILVTLLATEFLGHIPMKNDLDPNFQLGQSQAIVAFIVIVISLLVTVLSIIIQQWQDNRKSDYQPINVHDDDDNSDETLDNVFCEVVCNKNCHVNEEIGDYNPTNMIDVEDLGKINCDTSVMQTTVKSKLSEEARQASTSFASVKHINSTKILKKPTELRSSGDIESICQDNPGPSALCDYQYKCSKEHRRQCASLVYNYQIDQDFHEAGSEDSHQVFRHIVLLLLLSVSMVIGLVICLWKLIKEPIDGIFVELEFLDVLLNYGQGIFSFIIFGLDADLIIYPAMRLLGLGKVENNLPDVENLSSVTKRTCEQFLTYHYDKCSQVLPCNKQAGLKMYVGVFTGRDFVDWLIAIGLASDRQAATRYGKHLVLGRIIEHVTQKIQFMDSSQLYQLKSNC